MGYNYGLLYLGHKMARVLVQDWIAQTYQARSPNSSSRRTLNGYPQSTEGEGKFPSEIIGTPGNFTFTRKESPPKIIQAIQGNGATPNVVSVSTTTDSEVIPGTVVNINGTVDYDEIQVVVASVISTTQFTYETFNNTNTVANLGGEVEATGESPISVVDPESSCRGLYTTSTGRVFTCFAGEVLEILEDGSWLQVTSIGLQSSSVSFTDDGIHLVFCDGLILWTYKLDDGTLLTPSLPFTKPIKVLFSNSRLVCINDGTEPVPDDNVNTKNRFYFTELLDANDWPPLNYASAESSADPIIGMDVREGELWFFGPRSYEVWRADINPDLPFVKVGGSSTEIGCGALNSITSIAGQVFWLGSSTAGQNIVFMSNGYNAQRISTHAIEYALGQVGGLTSDARGFAYQQEGHTFYVLTLITGNRTFVFDLTTQQWHERSSRDRAINKENFWEILYTTFAFSKVLAGGLKNARILQLDLDRYIEWDGRPIVRLQRGPITFQNLSQVFHDRFTIDMETGIGRQAGEPYLSGVQTGEAVNPELMMRHSDDGGHTWSSQRKTTVGRVGQYLARVIFRRLGRSRERVYEISMSAPVKWHILGARLSLKAGAQP